VPLGHERDLICEARRLTSSSTVRSRPCSSARARISLDTWAIAPWTVGICLSVYTYR
jgi:hypothetical protein